MPEYKTPLPGILAAMLESGINRVLAMDENTPERLQRLHDRMLQLDIEGLGITLYFAFNRQRVEVGTQSGFEPDTVISGSPMALFSMAMPDEAGYWGTPESRVSISGDANLARDLERLFSRLDPDWEGRLSRLFGDVWGHQLAAGLRAGADQLKTSAGSAGDMVSEYLQGRESPVTNSEEFGEFAAAVEETREDIKTVEARLDELQQAQEESS
jgi:ubiquinone biosynthesis protein UbiJ